MRLAGVCTKQNNLEVVVGANPIISIEMDDGDQEQSSKIIQRAKNP